MDTYQSRHTGNAIDDAVTRIALLEQKLQTWEPDSALVAQIEELKKTVEDLKAKIENPKPAPLVVPIYSTKPAPAIAGCCNLYVMGSIENGYTMYGIDSKGYVFSVNAPTITGAGINGSLVLGIIPQEGTDTALLTFNNTDDTVYQVRNSVINVRTDNELTLIDEPLSIDKDGIIDNLITTQQ